MARILYRIDPTRRMHRFYLFDLQPDLFGRWSLILEWGRIGSPGRLRIRPYDEERIAAAALEHQARRKTRRGYSAP